MKYLAILTLAAGGGELTGSKAAYAGPQATRPWDAVTSGKRTARRLPAGTGTRALVVAPAATGPGAFTGQAPAGQVPGWDGLPAGTAAAR